MALDDRQARPKDRLKQERRDVADAAAEHGYRLRLAIHQDDSVAHLKAGRDRLRSQSVQEREDGTGCDRRPVELTCR